MTRKRRYERGFALVAALLANLILLAVGIVAINLSTQDIRISMKTLGEKKAFNAAEAGLHWLAVSLRDPSIAENRNNVAVTNQKITGGADDNTVFTITAPVDPPAGSVNYFSRPGYPLMGDQTWGQIRYDTTITGRNTAYNGEFTVSAAVGWGPVNLGPYR